MCTSSNIAYTKTSFLPATKHFVLCFYAEFKWNVMVLARAFSSADRNLFMTF